MKPNQMKSRSTQRHRPDLWLALALACCALLWTPAQAQMVPKGAAPATQVQIPDKLTQQQAHDLVARLTDAQVRALIIAELDKRAVEPAGELNADVYVGHLRAGVRVALENLARMFDSGDHAWLELQQAILQRLTDNGRISGWYLLLQFVGLLLAGWAVAALGARMFKRSGNNSVGTESLRKRFDLACFSLVRGLARIVAFAVGAMIFIEITTRQMPDAYPFWKEVVWCLVLLQLVALAARELASPNDGGLVLVSTKTAQQVLAWSLILSAALILPDPLVHIAIDAGVNNESLLLLSFLVGAVFVGLMIALLIRLRHYGTAFILGKHGTASSLRQGLARVWWILAIIYLLFIWMLAFGKRAATGQSSMAPGIASLALLAVLPYLDQGLKALITWYFSDRESADSDHPTAAGKADNTANAITEPAAGIVAAADASAPADSSHPTATGEADNTGAAAASAIAEPAAEIVVAADVRAPAYIATALRYARIVMVLVALAIFMRLWDIDIRALSAQFLGQRFASALFDISITVLLTWALWGIIRISIERKLDTGKSARGEQDEEAEAGGLGGSRVETVLPLIRIFIKITLVVMAVLISLSSLGVNIGPLIAGAGVVGIAIGFGAQTLVRDIVSGFFYLLDDAFRIGEYVVVDNIRGAVEKISIRSFQLRHHNGPVHTVPYGEIKTLTNWSRDWAIMKFELRIAFETDIDMVRKIIKRIGIEMMEDPEFGPLMLAPLKSQGVNRMDDSALIIRCKFTAIPGQQYLIRREAFTRIQRAFEEKGIQFAPRRVLVEATTHEEAMKGAAAVIDQERPADPSKPPPM
jgi:small-conductance mechanosensitive channel